MPGVAEDAEGTQSNGGAVMAVPDYCLCDRCGAKTKHTFHVFTGGTQLDVASGRNEPILVRLDVCGDCVSLWLRKTAGDQSSINGNGAIGSSFLEFTQRKE